MLDENTRKKALEARRAKIAAGVNLRRNWLDSRLWDEIARRKGIRLPQWHQAPERGKLATWGRKLLPGPFV